MAHPDAEWVGLGAKPCFRFEGRAAKRNALAAEFQGPLSRFCVERMSLESSRNSRPLWRPKAAQCADAMRLIVSDRDALCAKLLG